MDEFQNRLTKLLANHPPIRGWFITFELLENAGNRFVVRVQPEHDDLSGHPEDFAIESVPVIADYLRVTGAFNLFYEEAKKDCEEYLAKIRKSFNLEPGGRREQKYRGAGDVGQQDQCRLLVEAISEEESAGQVLNRLRDRRGER